MNTPLLLPAPGQSTCSPLKVRGRHWGCGVLMYFDNIHITQSDHGEITMEILRQSTEQLMRGDLESRTITFTAPPTRAGWQSAWRIARSLKSVRPGMVVAIAASDWRNVGILNVPHYLRNSVACLADGRACLEILYPQTRP